MRKTSATRYRLILVVAIAALLVSFPMRRTIASDCSRTSMGLIPLNDLGTGFYIGQQGGLYPNGSNTRPAAHEEAGLEMARAVRPLDASGQPSDTGRIVLASIGMSSTTQEFQTFKSIADADPDKNPNLTIVDGAQGGQDALDWANPTSPTWSVLANRLSAAGVSAAQVQVVWLKQQLRRDDLGAFPGGAARLRDALRDIVRIAKSKYPNLRIAYLSSRTYGGYNGELRGRGAYESGFAVKQLIEDQINGDPLLSYTGSAAPAPWLAWGPYLWADGLTPRSDGLIWACSDFNDDGIHPSPSGRQKVAQMLLDFFKSDSTARLWFLSAATGPIRVVLSRDVTNQLRATITITNPLPDAVPGVSMILVRASTLDGSAFVDGVPLPQSFGTLTPGQSVTATVTFPGTASVPSGFSGLVRVDLSYTGGTYTETEQVTTP